MNRKVTVVGGAGNVGATVARGVADKRLADVVVIDIADQKAAGVALDMLEACPIWGSDARILGTGDFAESAGSDIVVVTSGVPRKPGMSRDDLLNVNYSIMQSVTAQVVKHSPNCIIIPVANPLDAMAQAIFRLSGFPRERVIGMAGVLDSARMRAFIAKELNVSVENVHAFVLGGHGDTMVPLPRYSTVAGIPITDGTDYSDYAHAGGGGRLQEVGGRRARAGRGHQSVAVIAPPSTSPARTRASCGRCWKSESPSGTRPRIHLRSSSFQILPRRPARSWRRRASSVRPRPAAAAPDAKSSRS
jgi:hypothetical protein